ncbi:TPA: phage tail protein I [Vibrio vulnificus]|nr:phage tail protein I [Vibrio vulnificus]
MTVNSLLPPNASKHERDIEAVITPPLSFPNRDIWNPWKCPEHLLPHLAWALSVDNWSSQLTETQKRTIIANAIKMHRIKGTRSAVELVIESLGIDDYQVKEWFESQELDVGDFSVDINNDKLPINESFYDELFSSIGKVKNIRSSLTSIQIKTKNSAGMAGLPCSSFGEALTVYPYRITLRVLNGSTKNRSSVQAGEIVSIYPRGGAPLDAEFILEQSNRLNMAIRVTHVRLY